MDTLLNLGSDLGLMGGGGDTGRHCASSKILRLIFGDSSVNLRRFLD
jgi:hypothetical protein